LQEGGRALGRIGLDPAFESANVVCLFLPTEGQVEASEIAERIRGEDEERRAEADVTFRRFTAIYLGVIAMLLAITSLGGSNATKVMVNANIQASDIYGFYQSKYARQTSYRLAADQLEVLAAANPAMPEAAKTKIEEHIKRWRTTADRYETDPAGGQGKQELLVLGSVSIVAASRPLVKLSGALAVLATLLMINGYFLLVALPLD
jgi:hypothetical protein